MKNLKRILLISIVFLLSMFYINTVNATNTAKIASDTVRIRKEASTNSAILELVSRNQEVEILEKKDDWYKIKYKTITGYVKEDLLELDDEAKETSTKPVNTQTEEPKEDKNEENKEQNTEQNIQLEVNQEIELKSNISLKIVPLINSSDIMSINSKSKVQVKQIINDWCYIQSGSSFGWIRNNILVSNVESKQEPVKEDRKDENNEEKEEQKTGYVNVDTVNLRKEMSTSSSILLNLSKNTAVKILGEKNNWYNVEVNGIKGYVASKYISDKKVEDTVTSRGSDESREPKEDKPAETLNETSTTNQTTTQKNDKPKTNTQTNTNKETNNNQPKSSSNKGTDVVNYAKTYLGCRYVAGGNGPKSFDCSGFTSYVYKHFGVSLIRTSSGQRSNGKKVEKSNLQPGDIVCFTGHVGIYIGGNKFIHAANPKKGVIITSMSDSYYVRTYITARRVL